MAHLSWSFATTRNCCFVGAFVLDCPWSVNCFLVTGCWALSCLKHCSTWLLSTISVYFEHHSSTDPVSMCLTVLCQCLLWPVSSITHTLLSDCCFCRDGNNNIWSLSRWSKLILVGQEATLLLQNLQLVLLGYHLEGFKYQLSIAEVCWMYLFSTVHHHHYLCSSLANVAIWVTVLVTQAGLPACVSVCDSCYNCISAAPRKQTSTAVEV